MRPNNSDKKPAGKEMGREMNSLFQPNPPAENRRALFSLQDFPPISAPAPANPLFAPQQPTNNTQYEPERRMTNYQTSYNPQGMQTSYVGRGVPALMDTQNKVHGYGRLTWLSSKGGLLTAGENQTISFQAKEFFDELQNQADLLQVLRVGFTLKYTATPNDGNQFTATEVLPIYGEEADILFKNATEVDLEEANKNGPVSKDAYSVELETGAYQALLGAFERQGLHRVQLSSLHSQMSNYGDEKLFRYVGTSSMKRRQFIERRTHIFCLQNDDSITLQYPAVYQLIVLLSSFLLRRGGTGTIQCLYKYYLSNEVPQHIKDFIGFDRQVFVNLINAHNFAFAVFPNRTFVSARRNLPSFDYIGFVNKYFPGMMEVQQTNGFAQHQIQRSVTHPMRDQYGMQGRGYYQNYPMQHQQHHRPPHYQNIPSLMSNGNRHPHYVDQRMISPPTDDWNLMSNTGTWSSQTNMPRQSSRENSVIPPDIFNDNTLNNEYGNLNYLRQNDSGKVNSSVQASNPIGEALCVCKCTCGGGKSTGAIGSSRGLPTILPGVTNLGRPSSNSTTSSDEPPKFPDTYDLFGPNDVLSGSLDSLRLGQF